MEKKVDDKIIFDLSFNSLVRVLKNKKIYPRFRCFIGNNKEKELKQVNLYAVMMPAYFTKGLYRAKESPFFFIKTRKELYGRLMEMFDGVGTLEVCDENAAKIQTQVTKVINHIMHYCVEGAVDEMKDVEEIGREAFNNACTKIFGENFVDVTENTEEHKKHLTEMERLISIYKEMFRKRGVESDGQRIFHERPLLDQILYYPRTVYTTSTSGSLDGNYVPMNVSNDDGFPSDYDVVDDGFPF